MDHWFVLDLGDALLAGEAVESVRALYEQLGPEAGASAVLMRHESEGRLHCAVKLYFPPALETLALLVGADPCSAPSPDGLGVLAGKTGCPPGAAED